MLPNGSNISVVVFENLLRTIISWYENRRKRKENINSKVNLL